MLRDTSMANTRSKSTCSAARANGIALRTIATSVSTHRMFLITVVFLKFSAAAEGAAKPDRATASKYHLKATGTGG
jgi:hypothetical protein